MGNIINVGKLNYLNTIIFFLELEAGSGNLRFFNGHPSQLNHMLRNGEIDISPSSSIEFAMRPRQYLVLPDISISSIKHVKSVLLFSKVALSEISSKRIAITTASATSVALLRILLEIFMGHKPDYFPSSSDPYTAYTNADAVLAIGDDALMYNRKIKAEFVYDLGNIWHELTGLPFVFALWIMRRNSFYGNKGGFKQLHQVLLAAKRKFVQNKESYLENVPQNKWMSQEDILLYWQTLNYDLTPLHMESLKKFYELSAKMTFIPKAPHIAVADL